MYTFEYFAYINQYKCEFLSPYVEPSRAEQIMQCNSGGLMKWNMSNSTNNPTWKVA